MLTRESAAIGCRSDQDVADAVKDKASDPVALAQAAGAGSGMMTSGLRNLVGQNQLVLHAAGEKRKREAAQSSSGPSASGGSSAKKARQDCAGSSGPAYPPAPPQPQTGDDRVQAFMVDTADRANQADQEAKQYMHIVKACFNLILVGGGASSKDLARSLMRASRVPLGASGDALAAQEDMSASYWDDMINAPPVFR